MNDLGLALVLNASPVGVCLLDDSLTVLFWNRQLEKWTGQQRTAIVGSRLTEAFPTFAAHKYLSRCESVFEGGPPAVFSSRLHGAIFPSTLPDGRERRQDVIMSLVTKGGGDGSAVAMISVFDVTAQWEKERQFLDLVRLREQVLVACSHDLRNPLSALQGFAELLRERQPDASLGRLVDGVDVATRQLHAMVESLLLASRVQKGAVAFDESVDVLQVVDDTCQVFQPVAAYKKVRLTCSVGDAPATCRGSEVAVHRLVANLLSNAIKFSREGGAVSLSCARAEDRIALRVADDGVGMTDDELRKLFRRFAFSNPGTKGEKGTGLGLSIVADLTSRLGGTVEVASTPNCGSTFTVTLPHLAD